MLVDGKGERFALESSLIAPSFAFVDGHTWNVARSTLYTHTHTHTEVKEPFGAVVMHLARWFGTGMPVSSVQLNGLEGMQVSCSVSHPAAVWPARRGWMENQKGLILIWRP